jgi:hypothetical protein
LRFQVIDEALFLRFNRGKTSAEMPLKIKMGECFKTETGFFHKKKLVQTVNWPREEF